MAQTALVTGANKGIGFEIARLLGERGITAIIGARDEGRGEAAAAKLGLPFVRIDVTDPATVQAAAKLVDQEYGKLDILVNNAGIAVPEDDGLPARTSLEDLRRVFETNVFGVVTVTNAMLPLLRRSPSGRIVNQSSERGSAALALDASGPLWSLNNLPYNSAKAQGNGYTGFRTAAEGAEITAAEAQR